MIWRKKKARRLITSIYGLSFKPSIFHTLHHNLRRSVPQFSNWNHCALPTPVFLRSLPYHDLNFSNTIAMQFAIIGAGISGLVTAKTLREYGASVLLFEKENQVGGVWADTRTYPGLTTQNSKRTYAFSDYPMPNHFDEWPTAEQMREYLNGYTDKNGLREFIRFNTAVDMAEPLPNGGWHLTVTDQSGTQEQFEVDYLISAAGTYSSPMLPQVPHQEAFTGKVYHTSTLPDWHTLKDKKVVVVGFGKSATDVADYLSRNATHPPTIVYRKPRWKVARRVNNKIHIEYFVISRFMAGMSPYPRQFRVERILHKLGIPKKNWRMVEKTFTKQFGLDKLGMVPQEPVESTLNCVTGLAPEGFYDQIAAGKLINKQGKIQTFLPNGVELSTGEAIEADVVIFGTGFTQELTYFPEDVVQRLEGRTGNYQLYRHTLPVEVPDLAFIGYTSSITSAYNAEISARWLAEHLFGYMPLPDQEGQRAQIQEMEAFFKKTVGISNKNTCISPVGFQFAEDMLREMGAKLIRTKNPVKEWLDRFQPLNYGNLREELRRKKPEPTHQPQWGRRQTEDVEA